MWRGRGRWLGSCVALVLVAGGALTAATGPAAHAAGTCDPADPNTYRWVGGQADHDWMNPANWQHGPSNLPGAPNDNKSLGDPWTPGENGDTANTIACIAIASGSDFTELDNSTTAFVWVQELHISGSFTVHLKPENSGLLVMGPATSTLGPGVVIDNQGTFGGWSRIESQATVQLSSHPGFPATLSSQIITGTTYSGNHGLLIVQPGGQLLLQQSGMALRYLYGVELHATATLSNGYVAADWGTSFVIGADGRLELADDGGYYQGFSAGSPTTNGLTNGGLLVKTGGTGTSVVDATYAEVGSGRVEVQSGTLALPDGNSRQAQVASGRTLTTAKCAGRGPSDPCVPTTDPAIDEQSVAFTVPATDADGAGVVVHEDAPRAFTAHAEGLQATAASPAQIELRMGVAFPGETPVGLDVVHVDDRGVETVLPDCPATGLPAGVTNCVDRLGAPSSSRTDGQNVFMEVRTTQTSRYICRRGDSIAPVFLAGPVAHGGRLGRPVTVTAALNEAGTITVSGTIRTKRPKVRRLTLAGTASPAPGDSATVVLTLSKKEKRRLRASGAKKGSVLLTVVATDLRGNPTTRQVKVKLR